VFAKLGPAAHAALTSLLLYPPDFIADHAEAVDAIERQSAAAQLSPAMFENRVELVFKSETSADLGAIAAPTLVLCARDDILTPPRCSEEIAASIAGAKLQILEWGGHAVSRTSPSAFDQVTRDFLLDAQH
jgi:aminoacrylate hydrolase